jgi:hypothetical protein
MGISSDIKSVLETTGHSVYYQGETETFIMPCIMLRKISPYNYLSHSGKTGLKRDRFQITCIASTMAVLEDLINDVESVLILNRVDFSLCFPTETGNSGYDKNGFYSSRDYFVFYN